MSHARRLRPGSLVDVVAPASAFDREGFLRGVAALESFGFRVRYRPDVFDRTGFLAGDDARRLAELVEAIEAPDSDALWCARGGYGVTRLVERIPVASIARAGKLLVGFSDITALHALWLRAGVPSVHGSMVARLAAEPAPVQERIRTIVQLGRATPIAGEPLVRGRATGVLSGGNLAILAALCGTSAQPDLSGRIAFVEDVGERPYRLDRMFVQCRQAGLFKGIAGLALGEFTDCEEKDGSSTSAQVLEEHAHALGVPAIRALPCGHGSINLALPFGVPVAIDGHAGTLAPIGDLFDPGEPRA